MLSHNCSAQSFCGGRWEAGEATLVNKPGTWLPIRNIFFHDNAVASVKTIKDDDEKDRRQRWCVLATRITKASLEMEYQHRTYSTNISKEIGVESAPGTVHVLIGTLSDGESYLFSLLN